MRRPSARRPCSLHGVRRRARCLRTWLISTSSLPRGNLSSSTTSGAAIPSQAAVRTRIGPPPKTRAMMLERLDADGVGRSQIHRLPRLKRLQSRTKHEAREPGRERPLFRTVCRPLVMPRGRWFTRSMLSRNSISHNVFHHAPRKQVLKCSSAQVRVVKKSLIHVPTDGRAKTLTNGGF